jgi:hypothetical protein
MLGDEGTEQFTVETILDGESIGVQKIHDPFIFNETVIMLSRWDCFLSIFRRRRICVEVHIQGSLGAQRAIMTLDPERMARDTEEILEQRRLSRENSVGGFCYARLD